MNQNGTDTLPDPIERAEHDDWLTTAEAARLLRMRPRSVYDLVARRRIPHARAHGRLLFSRAQLRAWVDRGGTDAGTMTDRLREAAIVGSHDPLLAWAIGRLGASIAYRPSASRDGLEMIARRDATAALIHLPNEMDDGFNTEALRAHCAHLPVVALQWARREQGLLVAAGNPRGIAGIDCLLRNAHPVVMRQPAAGSNLLFAKQVRAHGGQLSQLALIEPRAGSESELARMVADGAAEAGFGIRAVARAHGLDFIPVLVETVDLVIWRRLAFEPAFAALLEFTRSAEFADHAAALGGYALDACRMVRFNP